MDKNKVFDRWFLDDLADSGREYRFDDQPIEYRVDEYYKASHKRAKRQAGFDVYAKDPLMQGYHTLSRHSKRVFDLNNNCYAWASGSTTTSFNRLTLNNGEPLCPQPGDSLGMPFYFFNGRPSSVFGHLGLVRRLCQLDQLQPIKVRRAETLPTLSSEQRLVGIALYLNDKGEQDYHCVVRSAGAEFFSHKAGKKLPPSMLDANGNLFKDPRRATIAQTISPWAFFAAPQAGTAFQMAADVRSLAQAALSATGSQREQIMTDLAGVAAQRSARFAKLLLGTP